MQIYRLRTNAQAVCTSFVAKFAHVSTIRRGFLSACGTYVLYPLHNQETHVCVYVLHLFVIEKTPVVR